jgi:hypothetical protein
MSILSTVRLFASLVFATSLAAFPADADDAHHTWENRAVAEAHFVGRFGGLISKNASLLQVANQVGEEAYSAYKALYPSFMQNKQKPIVILIESQDPFESFAFMPRMDGPRQGMLVMTEGLVNLVGIDKETQLGIVAHEMAHILFWHQDVDGKSLRPILRLGQSVTSETEESFSRWMFLATVAGGHSQSALNGLPLGGLLSDGIRFVSELIKERGKDDCGASLLAELKSSTSRIMENYSYYLWGFDLSTPVAVTNVRERSGALIEKINECVVKQPDLNEKFLHLRNYRLGGRLYPAAQILSRISKSLDISADTPDFRLIIEASRLAHNEMNQIFAREGFRDVRWYSGEDQADEAAATVLRHLKVDHRKYAVGIQSALQVPASDSSRCRADINSNSEPPYGEFSDPHHSNCWRSWRIINFGNQNTRLPYLQ